MQDEVNTKVIAIAIKGGKITAEVLEKALKKFVEEIEKAQKQARQPKTYRGKQSIKHLVQQNAAINNIEVTDGNIKSFQRTANKYGIDYALKKDTSEQPPRYLVFFKGRDVDEKDGQPAEKILGHVVKSMFLRDKVRPYRTNNLYAAIQRQIKEQEELQIGKQIPKGK